MSKLKWSLALAAAVMIATSLPARAEQEETERGSELRCLEACRDAEDACYEACGHRTDDRDDCYEDCIEAAEDCVGHCN